MQNFQFSGQKNYGCEADGLLEGTKNPLMEKGMPFFTLFPGKRNFCILLYGKILKQVIFTADTL